MTDATNFSWMWVKVSRLMIICHGVNTGNIYQKPPQSVSVFVNISSRYCCYLRRDFFLER